MSFMGGITDFLTGGSNQQAEDALNKALAAYSSVSVPTEQQLTLPQLQQYVQQGLMTAAQADAVLQRNNAMNNVKTDPRAKEAEMTALNQLQDLAAGGGKDAQTEATLANTESTMNQTMQGQRASILDQMAARGIPTSLMGTAAQLGAAGQDAEQMHSDALNANAAAAQRALSAMSQAGQLGGQIEQQNFGEESAKAQSQNAIDQWNAANQTNVNLANQQARQQANQINLTNGQNVANANTQNANARTQYNAQVPQQIYNDAMAKATGMAGVNEAQAKQYTGQGEQNAGTASTILNLVAPPPLTDAAVGGGGAASTGAPSAGSSGGAAAGSGAGAGGGGGGGATAFSSMFGGAGADAAMLAAHGGQVPGTPTVPGDSPKNDKVPAVLSPGEIVIPRTAAHSPNLAAEFVRHLHKAPVARGVHPEDVKSVLTALHSMRGGF